MLPMIACNFGDIVLIEFPLTDMRGVSRRPALVLNDSGDLDVLVARITSQEQSIKSDYKVTLQRYLRLLVPHIV